jgi:hypothetical protein
MVSDWRKQKRLIASGQTLVFANREREREREREEENVQLIRGLKIKFNSERNQGKWHKMRCETTRAPRAGKRERERERGRRRV